MNAKKCAKCEKTVYPTEELKCLEKVWHKACFKCQVCNMTLSMRNYKGFDKLPYCGAHVPKAKATIVADTPEMKRLAENSKNQSNVKYHAEFEAAKGRFTQIADDPEIERLKANAATISNITYHGVTEQKAEQEKKRSLVDGQPGAPPAMPPPRSTEPIKANEKQEQLQNMGYYENNQHQPVQQQQVQPPQQHRSGQQILQHPPTSYAADKNAPRSQNINYGDSRKISADYGGGQGHHSGRVSQTSISSTGSSSSYSQQHSIQARSQPLPPRDQGFSQQQPQQVSGYNMQQQQMVGYPQQQQQQQQTRDAYAQQQQANNMAYSRQQQQQQQHQQQLQYSQHQQYRGNNHQQQQLQLQQQQQQQQQQQKQKQQQMMRQSSGSGYYVPQQQQQAGGYRQQSQPQQQPSYHQQSQPQSSLRGRCYQAMYDYEAADTDEVSFKDGDLIVNCTSIDEGWMTGTVHRTGKFGMLPANYVEPVNI